jgi:hypothetical protein
MDNNRLIKFLLLAGLLLFLASILRKDLLPGTGDIDPSLYSDPVQTRTHLQPFRKQVDDNVYVIQPLYDYELYGMVVSYHDSDTWWDIYHHESWRDFINVKDLCVVWGGNLESGVYRDLSYDSDNWTCFIMTPDAQTSARFRSDQLSNNHLLNASGEIRDEIMAVGIGDQVHFKGHLVNYANPANNFIRSTSITRKDTGNGACETVYVEDFEVLKKNNPEWRTANLAAKVMIGAAIVLMMLNYLFGDVTSFVKK